MTVFTDFERDPCAGVGIMWEDFIQAVAMYVYTNEQARHPIKVQEVALAFNTTVKLAREAVHEHPWLFVRGDNIESDGE